MRNLTGLKLRILNAWGAPGGVERDGIYYEACRQSGAEFYDFRSASTRFGGSSRAFDGACKNALSKINKSLDIYDTILVDEAQDFSPSSFSYVMQCSRILSV